VSTEDTRVELVVAADGGTTADTAARTIEGIVVPFGPGGRTSGGLLTFAAGSVRISDPKRVKLLVEHDQRQSVGYGVEFTERPEGLWGKFHVPEGDPDGDRVLAQAANHVRDAFSVGVLLDASVETNLRRNTDPTKPVKGTGDLREVSMVAVPAFDDARVGSVAASNHRLVVSAWADVNHTEGNTAMPEPTTTAATWTAAATTEASAEATPAAETTTASTETTTAGTETTTAATGPEVIAAAAGSALTVSSEPSTYAFGGDGPSLVRDAFAARMDGDPDARERVRRFNAEIAAGNPSSVLALAAVETTTTAPNIVETFHRADLMRQVIDRGRPLLSRVNIVPISNANPYAIPTVGEFDGVDEHTEGTAHVAEGDLVFGGDTVTPRAASGAYRISRELIDSSNPLIDRVAMRKILRDYRRHTEAKAWTAWTTGLTATLSIDTVAALDAELDAFINTDEETADFAAVSASYLATLKADTDADGRPHLARYSPSNATGVLTRSRVGLVAEFGDTQVFRAGTVTANQAAIIREAGVHFAESRVQQFSFSEVEGPGIVKLALWAYTAAARLEDTDVQLVTSAAV
jgi:HK97 family phage prohead protease